jgi:hypothetical protein
MSANTLTPSWLTFFSGVGPLVDSLGPLVLVDGWELVVDGIVEVVVLVAPLEDVFRDVARSLDWKLS